MNPIAASPRAAAILFVGLVAAIYAAAIVIAGRPPVMGGSGAVGIGVALDLVLVVPLAYYFLILRRRRLPAFTVAPVVVIGALVASRLLPEGNQQVLRGLEVIAAPLELGILGWIAWRAAKSVRSACRDRTGDPLEQFHRVAFEFCRHERAAAILATEIAIPYYAFFAWRARPHVPAGWVPITQHRRGAHAAVVGAFLLVIAAETVVVHLLVARWSGLAAWLLTFGSVYAAAWLIADYRATVLRPILAGEQAIVFRAGMRCTAHVPRSTIAGGGSAAAIPRPDCAKLTFLGSPTRWIRLTEPMIARGPYGFRRPIRGFGIAPDVPAEFDAVLCTGAGEPPLR